MARKNESGPDELALGSYYEALATWLELRASAAEAERTYREARGELERFTGGHFPELHRRREQLIQAGVKLTPLGRLEILPQDPARLRRGAEYYCGLARSLKPVDSTGDSKV